MFDRICETEDERQETGVGDRRHVRGKGVSRQETGGGRKETGDR